MIHWGFGLRLDHGPDKAEESKEWMDFAAQNGLPNDHWWHIEYVADLSRAHPRDQEQLDDGNRQGRDYRLPRAGGACAGVALRRSERAACL